MKNLILNKIYVYINFFAVLTMLIIKLANNYIIHKVITYHISPIRVAYHTKYMYLQFTQQYSTYYIT